MPCYYPITVFKGKDGNVTYARNQSHVNYLRKIPCGRCIGCRLEYSKVWALRCLHESYLYDDNIFLTLTYDNDNIPLHNDLNPDDFTKFIKRLRYERNKNNGSNQYQRIRYYMCGEYGADTLRPHYHAILFNYRPQDSQLYTTRKGKRVYKSEELRKTWKKGNIEFSDVNFNTCAYVSRYMLKKLKYSESIKYDVYNEITGLVEYTKHREYTRMSRNPGIGYDFFKNTHMDTLGTYTYVLEGGVHVSIPRYYVEKADEISDGLTKVYKKKRRQRIENRELTPEQLMNRERVQKQRINKLERNFENE